MGSFLTTLLTSFATSALKIFLSGLFNTVLAKIQDDAQHQTDAAVMTAQTTETAAQVEIATAQAQAQIAIAATKPKPQDDPFGTDAWNKE